MHLFFEVAVLLAALSPAVSFALQITDASVTKELLWGSAAAVLCFITGYLVIPNASHYLKNRNICGFDRGKIGHPAELDKKNIPSALGLVAGVVYMVFIIVCQLVYAKDNPTLLANYNAALLSICFMVLLGFADDVLDLPWRYKLMLPTIASLPLLCTYSGVTSVLMPKLTRPLLWDAAAHSLTPIGKLINQIVAVDENAQGALVDLGPFYFVYMGMLAVFSTNTINIYAGINGLEAGQSLIIAISVLTANSYELFSGAGANSPHLFSAMLAMPFIAITAALLAYNRYPAQIFVGDTYCYFAGMTFAVMAILGHFSKTLLLFFIPQIINFLMSLPQLFKVYPCPRHRMPDYDPKRDVLVASTFEYKDANGNTQRRTNFTLINFILWAFGPMHERTTVYLLLALQIATCAFGLFVRYNVSQFIYGETTHAHSAVDKLPL